MSEETEHIHSSHCPKCETGIEELKARLEYIVELEEVIRREIGEEAVPERPTELQDFIASVERAREKMANDQGEIDRLRVETRSMISKLLAA